MCIPVYIGWTVNSITRRTQGSGNCTQTIWPVSMIIEASILLLHLLSLFFFLVLPHSLTWKELVDPVIQLCREGHHLTNHTGQLAVSIHTYISFKDFVLSVRALDAEWKDLSDNIRRIYTSENGTRKKFGDLVKRPDLARTLEYIAINGADAIYGNSSISRNIVQTIEAYNGILTLKDLMDYEVKVQEPVQAEFGGTRTSSSL